LGLTSEAIVQEQVKIPENNILRIRVAGQLDQLDSLLIAYKYDAGVRAVICENLIGTIKGTAFGDFLTRLARLKIIDRAVYQPNLFAFIQDLETIPACPRYEPPRLERNKMLDVLEGLLR
jgi:hypothetical protein